MSRFSDEEKAEIAFGSYLEMAKAINGMKQAIEYDITCSSEYKDEKAYYTNLLSGNWSGVINAYQAYRTLVAISRFNGKSISEYV